VKAPIRRENTQIKNQRELLFDLLAEIKCSVCYYQFNKNQREVPSVLIELRGKPLLSTTMNKFGQ
jgi:hypothetical protein